MGEIPAVRCAVLALACSSSVSGTVRSFFSHLAAIQVGTLSTP